MAASDVDSARPPWRRSTIPIACVALAIHCPKVESGGGGNGPISSTTNTRLATNATAAVTTGVRVSSSA